MELAINYDAFHHQCLLNYEALQSKYEIKNQEMIDYKYKANYWEAQFNKVKSREEILKTENEELKAQLCKREQQLFGKKSEKNAKNADHLKDPAGEEKLKKNRGQQSGSQGHGRRDYSELPVIEEVVSLTEEGPRCPCCHLPYETLPGTVDSEILELVSVQAYRRAIRKRLYKRHCVCKGNPAPKILSAPPTERLFSKSRFGITIWALLLLKKYEYQQPLYRSLEELSNEGLPLAMGTVVEGLKKLLPLLVPVYDAIVERSVAAQHWHADETGWKVFETIEGKLNHRWFLWIFHNKETVVYKMSPTRSSKVLTDYFGEDHQGGTLNVDRYSAYKVIAKSGLFILAFCWAHVRRDFLAHAKGYVQQEKWALSWVEKIGGLYHINNERIQHRPTSKSFRQLGQTLRAAIHAMRAEIDEQLSDDAILPSAKKLIVSLKKHWAGLTVFVDYPEIPMDNNLAERGLRSSVVGRKNYYGSGAVWSAELAATLFTLFETLKLWKINLHTWLLTYFYECTLSGGTSPEDITKYLPWKMTVTQREFYLKPPNYKNYELITNPATSE